MFSVLKNFIPFGFQYYRAPTPKRVEWESDLKQIASMGFNTVKYWVQWRSSCSIPDCYLFDDIHELSDLAYRYGLKVVLNVIFDAAPAWFYKKYPESKMITADGSIVEPDAVSCRQLGGAPGPCYHHDEAAKYKDAFLLEAVKKFKDHPALIIWDLWNEPELTTGFRRDLSFSNQVCYCKNSFEKFQEWLENKYGSIDQLNKKWQRGYNDWSEVEAPRGQAIFNDLIDWRLFFRDTLTQEMKRRVEIVKTYDMVHPVMCHTVPLPVFNLITCGSDDFDLAEPCDLFGNSLGSSAWAADMLKSAAKEKKLINSEIHALPGTTVLKPKKPDWKAIKKHILIPLARGVTGFLFWQYRPEISGLEAPAWGSTYLDGSVTPWLDDISRLNNIIQKNCGQVLAGSRKSDGIAIFTSAEGQIANFAAFGHLESFNASMQGVHKLIHDLNYKVEFINEKDIDRNLSDVKCLWMPFPIYLNEKLCNKILKWIENGGVLISECSFGMIEAENGLHSCQVPGYGFDRVFGVREKWIHSAEFLDHSYHNIVTDLHQKLIPITHDDQYIKQTIFGSYYQTEIDTLPEARILARFANNNDPAVTSHAYGKGKAIWIGTLLGAAYWAQPAIETRRFVKSVLLSHGIKPYIESIADGVRVDILEYSEQKAFIFIENMNDIPVKTGIIVQEAAIASCKPWFSDGYSSVENNILLAEVDSGDIQVFDIRFNEQKM